MILRFVCLANSFKEGGRCLAGIVLDENNKPVYEGGRPKWIRPVTRTTHGEIPTLITQNYKIGDILDLRMTGKPDVKSYQSENIYFLEHSIDKIGRFDKEKLINLCENPFYIFGDQCKALNKEMIKNIDYSLMMVKTESFETFLRKDEFYEGSQLRLIFEFNRHYYDFPVTDPIFISNYQKRNSFLSGVKSLLLVLSLGIEWNGWFYKLIAGVIRYGE